MIFYASKSQTVAFRIFFRIDVKKISEFRLRNSDFRLFDLATLLAAFFLQMVKDTNHSCGIDIIRENSIVSVYIDRTT